MASTFTRLEITLRRIRDNPTVSSRLAVAAEIRGCHLQDFRVKKNGNSDDDFMSVASIDRLVGLLKDLELVTITTDGNVIITEGGAQALNPGSAFSNKISSATKSLLRRRGVPLTAINAAIKRIGDPDTPNAPTIYRELNENGAENAVNIRQSEFTRLMFLLASAGGITRKLSVHYTLSSRR